MRSSQKDEYEARRIQKQMEERERLERMLENRELTTDIPTSNKLYELWLEKLGEKPGFRQDDKHDLKPHASLMLHA